MAYTKTVWVDNQAPAINADNLNKIENGIAANDVAATKNAADIVTAKADIATKASGYPYTITLTAAGWSNNTQNAAIAKATATNSIVVSPIPANQSAYSDAGILCTAQATGSITFVCDSVPATDIQVNVLVVD